MNRGRKRQRVVVIGAGFAGLAAALRLAQAGAAVTVLDALDAPGGKAALGFAEFSSGPTVVTMPQVFQALGQRTGLSVLALSPARPTTTYHARSGRTFAPEALHVAGGLAPTLAQLSSDEGRKYEELLFRARQLYVDAAPTFLFGPPPTLTQLARYSLTSGWRAAPLTPLHELVQSGPFLTPFWLRFATYLGANPYRAPAVLHNIAWVELGQGVWHLKGGLLAFAGALHARAQQLGVHFEFGTRVEHLIERQGQVRAAHTSRGVVLADAWVSAVDREWTLGWLGRPASRTPRGVSGFALQLHLEQDMGHAHHVFWPAEYAREWRDLAAGQLPSDPTLYLHLDGSRAFLLVNAPPDPAVGRASDEYARFLLRQLQTRFPLPVRDWLALTPAAYARTAVQGALYGRAPHGLVGSLRPGWTFQGVQNLRQVGGTVYPGGGVPLSILSGWNGAGHLLGLPYDDLAEEGWPA